jgi:hypothetical protein
MKEEFNDDDLQSIIRHGAVELFSEEKQQKQGKKR